MASDPRDTPAMQQFYRFKRQHPGCVLLFRMGDFYEAFDEDAVTLHKALGLTLTQRTAGLPMAGVPYHQIENYLRRLIAAGFRVAVADQVQDPKEAKGLVERAVTRVLTPGTLVDEALLDQDSSSSLAAVCFTDAGDDSPASVAIIDLSTGAFTLCDCDHRSLADELARRHVTELLYAASADGRTPPRVERLAAALAISATARPAWQFRADDARRTLLEHFAVATLAGFGLRDEDAAIPAAGAAVAYLAETQALSSADRPAGTDSTRSGRPSLRHLQPPRRDSSADRCIVDRVSLRALEVEATIRAASRTGFDGTLLGLFLAAGTGAGCMRTAVGRRLMRDWLCAPLADRARILARQHAVATFVEDRKTAAAVRAALDDVQDVARIAARVALGRATPRDLVALGRSVAAIGPLLAAVADAPALATQHTALAAVRDRLEPMGARITSMCVDSPPPHLREGGLFRDGVDAELDNARLLQRDAGSWLSAYQERLIAQFDLPGLKVGFNKIFGYFIELPAGQAKRAPDQLKRTQTLKNAERYTTPELRDFESKVTTAQARAIEREKTLFLDLCAAAVERTADLASFAQSAAELDVLQGFAERAVKRRWVRPDIVDEPTLAIHAGRHPVLEELLGADFVANDCELGVDAGAIAGGAHDPAADTRARLALITGPNMAGKSTYIRQVALLTLLAHTGSFVPADRATIGIVDRIFTRIGADDALHAGQSTFMVEMTETANILNHATPRSLIVLDEIGRGTSTYDGLSLAWAIAENLAALGARSLFATHYHELTDIQDDQPGRVRNLHVSVREWPSTAEPGHTEIVFLHRILPGRTDQSYGIHVARLAGIPRSVIERARDVLASLAAHHGASGGSPGGPSVEPKPRPARQGARDGQLALFTEYLSHPAVDQLREIKLDTLSPIEAFDALRRLKSLLD